MDASITRLAGFAAALRFEHIDAAVVHDCKRRLIDALGCGLAAFDAPAARIARRLACRTADADGAVILGTSYRALPELAAFANGVAVRYLDGNDTFPGGGGHPSDVFAAVLAAADYAGAGGQAVITAAVAAYEVYGALFRAVNMREHGLDHVFYTAVASAAGACSVLGLGAEQTAQAIALAVTPNIALEATRRGELSEWKGCAAGNAARNGLFAALLAREGMSGPPQAVEGAHGLRELIGNFTLPELAEGGSAFWMTRANLKPFLAEYHAQGPIAAALSLNTVKPDDIERVILHTYHFAWSEAAQEPEKWRPRTRETADHSIPYMLAATLLDGAFSDAIFDVERLNDPRIYALLDRLEVREDPALTARFPAFIPCRLEVLTKSGETRVAALDYPPGHIKNPLPDTQVEEKFRALAGRCLDAQQLDRALNLLGRLDRQQSLHSLWHELEIQEAP